MNNVTPPGVKHALPPHDQMQSVLAKLMDLRPRPAIVAGTRPARDEIVSIDGARNTCESEAQSVLATMTETTPGEFTETVFLTTESKRPSASSSTFTAARSSPGD